MTENGKEYQLAAVAETGYGLASADVGDPFGDTAYAAPSELRANAIVRGNYNRIATAFSSGSERWFVAMPSIILSDLSSGADFA